MVCALCRVVVNNNRGAIPALPGTDNPLAIAVEALFLTILWADPHLIH